MESGFHPGRSTGGRVEKGEPRVVSGGVEIMGWLGKAALGHGYMIKKRNTTSA